MLFERISLSTQLSLIAASTDFSGALFEVIQQERNYLEHWMDWPHHLNSPARCERYLRELQLINRAGQQFFSFIFYQEQLAGSIALARIDRRNQSGELAFWKSKSWLPKAKMHLATQAFIDACWQNSTLHRLEVQTAALNLSAKLLSENLGFRLEGSKKEALLIDDQFVDLDIYGLLRNPKATN